MRRRILEASGTSKPVVVAAERHRRPGDRRHGLVQPGRLLHGPMNSLHIKHKQNRQETVGHFFRPKMKFFRALV